MSPLCQAVPPFSDVCRCLPVDGHVTSRDKSAKMSSVTATNSATRPAASQGASPPARRSRPSPWRDPRLVIGIALVAVSVLAGARLFAISDDTVAVWAVRTSIPSGATLHADDLVRTEVRFADGESADRYVSASSAIRSGTTVLRELGAGELLPRAAVATEDIPDQVEVPLSVPSHGVPATVAAGAVVDVWVTLDPATLDGEPESVLVLDDVVVVAAPRSGSALGPASTRQVIVGVPAGEQAAISRALAVASTGSVVLTRQA